MKAHRYDTRRKNALGRLIGGHACHHDPTKHVRRAFNRATRRMARVICAAFAAGVEDPRVHDHALSGARTNKCYVC